MFARHARCHVFALVLLVLGIICPQSGALAQSGLRRLVGGREPGAVENLAKGIDDVEKELNEMGTVVAKKADVWGESRLTKHRQEFEKELAKKIDNFELLLNARVRRSDQAYLANALSIQAALGGYQFSNVNTNANPQSFGIVPSGTATNAAATAINFTLKDPASLLSSPDASATTVKVDSKGNPQEITYPAGTQIFRTPPNMVGFTPNSAAEFGFKGDGIGLEPTIVLDQMKRYIDHLNEIRRINEGGDTADSPGYSLNLVRIPISIIPGEKTRRGYGADITITAEAHITTELLPQTFRDLVIQDLLDQLAVPIRKTVDLAGDARAQQQETAAIRTMIASHESESRILLMEIARLEAEEAGKVQKGFNQVQIASRLLDKAEGVPARSKELIRPFAATPRAPAAAASTPSAPRRAISTDDLEKAIQALESVIDPPAPTPPEDEDENDEEDVAALSPQTRSQATGHIEAARESLAEARATRQRLQTMKGDESRNAQQLAELRGRLANVDATLGGLRAQLQQAAQRSAIRVRPSSPSRRARMPIAPTRIVPVFGDREIASIAADYLRSHDGDFESEESHLTDVRGFLQDELAAAYGYLASTHGERHWQMIEHLADAVRSGADLTKFREQVIVEAVPADSHDGQPSPTTLSALAWAVLVESAVLNDHLNDDLKRVSQDPNCQCNGTGPHPFYGPDPPPAAREAFIQYVKCRWPIHVFALDPVVQEQNIADSFSMRREMQFALALAFAGGQLGAQSASRYMRRIELDLDTIALNRTHVAFGHGDNTFGWRFQPRVQTPDIEPNATVIFRDLLWGGPRKDCLMRDWRIEPGMRECVALVVMPSFVPHVKFETRSHWYRITDPDDVKGTAKKAMELSRKIKCMTDSAHCCHLDARCYRDGDVQRLLARVEQLSQKLPLQTFHAQVPYENTLGGFEMFSAGVSDLAPELHDYYGEPGISPNSETVLFLAGNHFSVHDTHVIAGNRNCKFELISRNVMKVWIPSDVRRIVAKPKPPATVAAAGRARLDGGAVQPAQYLAHGPAPLAAPLDVLREVVDVHIATPYGVTGHLHIPVVQQASTPAGEIAWDIPNHDVTYFYKQVPVGMAKKYEISSARINGPKRIVLRTPQNLIPAATVGLSFSLVMAGDFVEPNSATPVTSGSFLLSNIPYDPLAGGYVVAGSNLNIFHREVMTRFGAYRRSILGDTDSPNPYDLKDSVFEVRLSTSVVAAQAQNLTPVIARDMTITIHTEQFPQ